MRDSGKIIVLVQEDFGAHWMDVGPVFTSYRAAIEWATAPGVSWIRPYRIVQVLK